MPGQVTRAALSTFEGTKTMANENNTNAPRAPLTPDQVKARDAVLAASKGATPQVPALPGTAPLGVTPVTVEHKPGPPPGDSVHGKVTGDGKPTGKPAILPDLTAEKAHAAAIAKANENTGKPPQGGTVTKGKTPATPAVTAAKPVKLTPRETAAANPVFTRGYDFSKWPVALAAIKPSAVVIDGVRATGVLKTLQTKTELALCVYAMPNAQRFNVYDVAVALQAVCGGSVDHKMNTVNQKAVPSGMWLRLNPAARAAGLADGKMAIAYAVGPSHAGLKKIMAVLGDKMPKHWLPETAPKPASDKGKVLAASQVANTGK